MLFIFLLIIFAGFFKSEEQLPYFIGYKPSDFYTCLA